MTGPRRRPFLQASLALLASCSPGERAPPGTGVARAHPGEADLNAGVPVPMSTKIPRLIASYPDHLAHVEGDALVWRDGSRMPIGAGSPRDLSTRCCGPRRLQTSSDRHTNRGPRFGPPPRDYSPGRLRNTAFFVKMYGDCHAGRGGGSAAEVGNLDAAHEATDTVGHECK